MKFVILTFPLEPETLYWVIKYLAPPLIFIGVSLFGIGYLLPRTWIHLERAFWKLVFDRSAASDSIINYALKDFYASIREIELDDNAPRTLAIILAIGRRLRSFPSLYSELKQMHADKVEKMFPAAIEKLNDGWQRGTPALLLQEYMDIIFALASHPAISARERIRGLSSATIVQYALGDLLNAHFLAEANYREAGRLHPSERTLALWQASYAKMNTTLFLGDFEKAMDSMATMWHEHYKQLNEFEKLRLREELSGLITLNPILAVPRHIILAAAFNDGSITKLKDSRYWPSQQAFDQVNQTTSIKDIEREVDFVDAWYLEARTICADEIISLNFSHAYSAFYYTLLLLEPGIGKRLRKELHAKINCAFESIKEPAPIVSVYVQNGFAGVYHLACQRNTEALESFRLATASSSISGNSFALCIFMCCHAVAAQRLNPAVESEVEYYLKQAKKLADSIGGDFYPRFWARAAAAVASLQGKHGKAQRHLLRSKQGHKGSRLMRIFETDIQEPLSLDAVFKPALQS